MFIPITLENWIVIKGTSNNQGIKYAKKIYRNIYSPWLEMKK